MALREIRKEGDSILKKRAKEVLEINENVRTLLDDMLETMYHNDGAGLAAPQIGILKRAVVIDVGEGPVEMINPKIIESDGEQVEIEGCLSIPGVLGEVRRPARVVAEALDRNGNLVRVEGEGLLARAICHELDHLDGILFTEKVIRFVEPEGSDNSGEKSGGKGRGKR